MKAAQKWQTLFKYDRKDIGGAYTENAVLQVDLGAAAKVFEKTSKVKGHYFVCHGRKNITEFWCAFWEKVTTMEGCFETKSPCTTVVEGPDAMTLQSKFFTKCFEGWIHGRYMTRVDGELKIQADHMEIVKVVIEPQGAVIDLSHINVAEGAKVEGRSFTDKQVRDSLWADEHQFQKDFNAKNHAGCAAAYDDTQTVMRADIPAVKELMMKTYSYEDPVVLRDKADIELFWKRMIHEVGLKDMKAYEKITGAWPSSICVVNDNMALVRSKWRMNAVGGDIHTQRMVRAPGKHWTVAADFFAIYDGYS